MPARHAEDPFINLDKIEAGKGADERAGDASLYGGNARASKDGDWSESYMVLPHRLASERTWKRWVG